MIRLMLFFVFFLTLPLKSQEIKTLADNLASKIKDKTAKVAVMEFPYTDAQKSQGPVIVQERLVTALSKNNVQLIERSLIKKIMEELKLQQSGAVNQEEASKLGKLLGADLLIIGTLNDIEKEKTEINSRIVNVKTGEIVSAESAQIKKTWKDLGNQNNNNTPDYAGKSLVQIAILLDTSNSMDGLINQARGQIWKIINELAGSAKNGDTPILEVALYEYGNNKIPKEKGHVRQVMAFTKDLDKISKELFALFTNGGDEYCGEAISQAVSDLKWSAKDDVYKSIFIAGNEPFTQGSTSFETAIAKAKSKGIFVNTIFCGRRQEGIATLWAKAAQLSDGEYSNIDQNISVADISTPSDDKIAQLNQDLNSTYVPYGKTGKQKMSEKKEMEESLQSAPKSVAYERASYFGQSAQAKSVMSSWDLISAIETGSVKREDIKKEELPDDLKKMSKQELNAYIDGKLKQRAQIKEEMTRLKKERDSYIEKMKEKNAGASFEDAVINSIRKQASGKGYTFSK